MSIPLKTRFKGTPKQIAEFLTTLGPGAVIRGVYATPLRNKPRPIFGPLLRLCPGGKHGWFETNVGPVRKDMNGMQLNVGQAPPPDDE